MFGLANLNVKGRQRVERSVAILQATCIAVTLIPHLNRKFNMSMGGYGCRDATESCPYETVLGFPFRDFKAMLKTLNFLSKKAIPNSRAKNALAMLKHKEAEDLSKIDSFN